MGEIFRIIVEYKILDFGIVAMGLFGFAVVADRVKALYFDYALRTDAFMSQLKELIHQDKIEEAVAFCGGNAQKPLAHVLKGILERSDREDAAMERGGEIALSEVAPHMSKRLGYLSMIANVATMVGLLGTVFGLIMSFKAISFADPAQKQTLLAEGIAMAMHATAMGLAVAIPMMVIYSFLQAKQNRLFADIDEASGKLLDLLRSRSYEGFSEKGAFPNTMAIANNKKMPPPGKMPEVKAPRAS